MPWKRPEGAGRNLIFACFFHFFFTFVFTISHVLTPGQWNDIQEMDGKKGQDAKELACVHSLVHEMKNRDERRMNGYTGRLQ
mmetsp:Transcript_43842/g.104479  ORF Transcript_43842/g.104479 Transcript_43842/m.104479 type:complete len:82 (+) Transcript_43842:2567-2812(+)